MFVNISIHFCFLSDCVISASMFPCSVFLQNAHGLINKHAMGRVGSFCSCGEKV